MRYDLTDTQSFIPCESAGMCMQAPLHENKDHDEEDLCIVCWERLREVIFYNCMHMVGSHPPTCFIWTSHPALQSAISRAAIRTLCLRLSALCMHHSVPRQGKVLSQPA